MKRDMELIRKILFYIEENYKAGQKWICAINIEGYEEDVVMEHIILAYQNGFIQEIQDVSTLEGKSYFVGNLSNSGYDFLDKVRSDTVWNKTKKTIKENGLPMLTGTISTIANTFIAAATEGVASAILKNGGYI